VRKNDVSKDHTISIRVSAEDKRKIKEKAKSKNRSMSDYVADAAIAGFERKNSRDKKRIVRMVKNQDILNDIFRLAKETEVEDKLYEKFMELMEGENELWQYLK